jgi:hypothetical protein
MIDTERTAALATSLEADGYHMAIGEDGARVCVVITATPEACADCLVPKDFMRDILSQTLGVSGDTIDITYPRDLEETTG